MKKIKEIKKEHVWLTCLAAGPLFAFLAVFNPSLIMIAGVFLIIGLRGVLGDVM